MVCRRPTAREAERSERKITANHNGEPALTAGSLFLRKDQAPPEGFVLYVMAANDRPRHRGQTRPGIQTRPAAMAGTHPPAAAVTRNIPPPSPDAARSTGFQSKAPPGVPDAKTSGRSAENPARCAHWTAPDPPLWSTSPNPIPQDSSESWWRGDTPRAGVPEIGVRNWLRTSEEVPDKGDSRMAIKIIFCHPSPEQAYSQHIAPPRRLSAQGVKSPANPSQCDLAIATPAPTNPLHNRSPLCIS